MLVPGIIAVVCFLMGWVYTLCVVFTGKEKTPFSFKALFVGSLLGFILGAVVALVGVGCWFLGTYVLKFV